MIKHLNSKNEGFFNEEWSKHVRLRPGMFIGSLYLKSFVNSIKSGMSELLVNSKTNQVRFYLGEKNTLKLKIENIQNVLQQISFENKSFNNPLPWDFQTINALSEWFDITYYDSSNSIIEYQKNQKGIITKGNQFSSIECNALEINFELDNEMWAEKLKWNKDYIIYEIRELAYFHQNVKFEVEYRIQDKKCNSIFHFKQGLKDRLEFESIKGIGGTYFNIYINTIINNIPFEAAIAFRNYNVDGGFIKSYVNDFHTTENGSHVQALLKGITYGVMKYFKKNELTQEYKISQKGIKENLIAFINIRMEDAQFSGCVKNKLANPEIIKPISDYVSTIVFQYIENNEKETEQLIKKFKMYF